VHSNEVESSKCQVSGIIIKKFSDVASRAGGAGTLQDYLVRDKVVGICDLDTRALVRHIRKNGAMNCLISTEISDLDNLKVMLSQAPNMDGLELASRVACSEAFEIGNPDSEIKIAVLYFGVKLNILRCLEERGAVLKVFPLNVTLEEIQAWGPDGVMFSNGPGDPSAMPYTIELTAKIIETGIPCFGICLGHQLIGLSQGLNTVKMFNGHRGVNHPIKNLITGKGEITSQNHGFVISRESIANNADVEITHVHLNDDTVAGIRLKSKPVFSVQYHPEASAGPHDSRYLFDDFIANVKSESVKA
jgi:carbamoyl-phosphate synthase small subunit